MHLSAAAGAHRMVAGCAFAGLFLFSYYSFAYCSNAIANVDTLRFVHVVYRHGDHGPDIIALPDVPLWERAPNPEHAMTNAPFPFCIQLGTEQVRLLGTYLRRRYIDTGFLSKYYNATELYCRAMDYDLAIVSAMANLEVMYPPSKKTEWMKGMGWQLIPVHTVSREYDMVLWMDRPCPKAESVTVEDIERATGRGIEAQYQGILSYLREKTGYPMRTFIEYDNIYKMYLAEKTDNISWPSWMNESIYNRTVKLEAVVRNHYFKVPWVHRLRGAPLFKDIAERTLEKTKSTNFTLKYYTYATAAATMMGLLESWGVSGTHKGISPFEGSALMVELHERRRQYFVEVWYVNVTEGDKTVRYPVRTCTDHEYECPLDKFVELARQEAPATVADWFAECGIYSPEHLEIDRLTIAVEILGMTTAIVLILLVGTVAYSLPRLRRDYTPIN